jgi:hypothetical protein
MKIMMKLNFGKFPELHPSPVHLKQLPCWQRELLKSASQPRTTEKCVN